MAQALARRGEDEERALALDDKGRRTGDGAALTRALSRRYGDRITGSFTVPGREGAYAPIPDDVPHALRSALHSRGVERLYSHQADAWHAAQRGEHVATATPTASGKSLCYTLPVVAAAMSGRAKATRSEEPTSALQPLMRNSH